MSICDVADTAGLKADHISLQHPCTDPSPFPCPRGGRADHAQSWVLFCTPSVVPVTLSLLSCGTISKTACSGSTTSMEPCWGIMLLVKPTVFKVTLLSPLGEGQPIML